MPSPEDNDGQCSLVAAPGARIELRSFVDSPRLERLSEAAAISGHARWESRQDLVAALQGVARGERQAFELVYAATSLKLYGIVVRIVGRELADEVLQEVYVRIWRRAGDFDPSAASPITSLAAIARNLAVGQERREIVLLAYHYGMTREDISNRFGRPVATVKTWLRRSLAQLKDCLGQ